MDKRRYLSTCIQTSVTIGDNLTSIRLRVPERERAGSWKQVEAVLFTVFHDNQENTRIRNAYVPTKPEIPKTRSRVPSAIRLGLTATEDFMRVESVTSSSWSASTEYARSEPAMYIFGSVCTCNVSHTVTRDAPKSSPQPPDSKT